MYKTIGFIEFNSIAQGIEAADFMLKAAEVELIFSKPVCPGKFILLVAGDVAAVNSAVEAGSSKGSQYVVDKLIISNVHPQIIPAITGTSGIEEVNSLGVMEFFSIAGAVISADVAAKSALVQLMEIRLGVGIGGKSFVTLTGDVSAVKEAVDSGIRVAQEAGNLINYVVIPSPRKEVFANLL